MRNLFSVGVLFSYISMVTITTFPGASLIPDYKLSWIGKKVYPLVVCLVQTSQIEKKPLSDNLLLSDSQIGSFQSSLWGAIIHTALPLVGHVI